MMIRMTYCTEKEAQALHWYTQDELIDLHLLSSYICDLSLVAERYAENHDEELAMPSVLATIRLLAEPIREFFSEGAPLAEGVVLRREERAVDG
jgi:hypothetical protein